MNLPRREVKITSETDITIARKLRDADLESVDEYQPRFIMHWRRDVANPAITLGVFFGLALFAIALLVADSLWAALSLMVGGGLLMFVFAFWVQMLAYDFSNKITREYRIRHKEEPDAVFIETERSQSHRQLQRQPTDLNEPLAIMARAYVFHGSYAGPEHLPAREGLRAIGIKMSDRRFGKLYEALDKQGYITGKNKLVASKLRHELQRRAAATPTPATERAELRPA